MVWDKKIKNLTKNWNYWKMFCRSPQGASCANKRDPVWQKITLGTRQLFATVSSWKTESELFISAKFCWTTQSSSHYRWRSTPSLRSKSKTTELILSKLNSPNCYVFAFNRFSHNKVFVGSCKAKTGWQAVPFAQRGLVSNSRSQQCNYLRAIGEINWVDA